MAGIQNELNQIKNAVYGREVRRAIHDGIKKAYDDAAESGNANMEVVMARGKFNNLNNRLNSIDRLKADQSFVDAQFASIVSGAPKGTYASLQALRDAYPNGEEGVFLVLSDGNWYYWSELEKDWLSGGVYQSTGLSDGSVTMPKLEVNLRQDLQDLFNAFVEKNDFIPVELFDKNEVKQGGVTSSGTTESLTRTHIEIEVEPDKEYYVTIPESEYLRIRSITSWNDNSFIEWNQHDAAFKGNNFVVPPNANKVIVSFCKENTSAILTVQETINELVSIFELKFNDTNLVTDIKQGGIGVNGEFTENLTRTRTDLIEIQPFTICHAFINEEQGLYIRSIHGYLNGSSVGRIRYDDQYSEVMFTIPRGIDSIAFSFCRADTTSNLNPNQTRMANPTAKEAYK